MMLPYKLTILILIHFLLNNILLEAASWRTMEPLLFEVKKRINGKILDIVILSKPLFEIITCRIVDGKPKVEVWFRDRRLLVMFIQVAMIVTLIPLYIACTKPLSA
jgi:hypothetical protein